MTVSNSIFVKNELAFSKYIGILYKRIALITYCMEMCCKRFPAIAICLKCGLKNKTCRFCRKVKKCRQGPYSGGGENPIMLRRPKGEGNNICQQCVDLFNDQIRATVDVWAAKAKRDRTRLYRRRKLKVAAVWTIVVAMIWAYFDLKF